MPRLRARVGAGGARPGGPTAAAFVPAEASLQQLAAAAEGCRGCPLWEPATQVVFGAGPAGARLVRADDRDAARAGLVADLRVAAAALAS